MTTGNSRGITTSQEGVHDKLDELVLKYQQAENRRPVSAHTQDAYEHTLAWLGDWQGDIVLDSCCGVGQSTATLAQLYPNARVIGIDKSAQRVDKHAHYASTQNNYMVVRADVNDFWRLVRQARWKVIKHYLLYPNPYPKGTQVQKRWHASPAMVDLMAICPHVEVRSNWKIYCQEFAQAASAYGLSTELKLIAGNDYMTPFEKKYCESGQSCWQINCKPSV